MHKIQFSFLITMFVSILFAQNLDEINTLEKAEDFIQHNPEIKSEITYLETTKDSLEFYKDSFSNENFKKKNKVVDIQYFSSMRVNYIYLDGKKLSLDEIDIKRKRIVNDLKNGTSFPKLSKNYTMDGSDKNDGDLGWFEDGVMHLIFEKAIKEHKRGEIFLVDIPENDWYYVVQKSFDDIQKVKIYILTVNN